MVRTMEKAQVSLPSDTEVRVTRDFAAPRQLVWRAHTDPKLVRRWMLGPPGWSMPVCEMDVRPGGKYRWRWRSDQNGAEFGFHGDFPTGIRAMGWFAIISLPLTAALALLTMPEPPVRPATRLRCAPAAHAVFRPSSTRHLRSHRTAFSGVVAGAVARGVGCARPSSSSSTV